MPTLSKRIDFSFEELNSALNKQASLMKKELPAGRISEVTLDRADPQKVLVKLSNDRARSTRLMRMDLNFVAAALIRLCGAHQIPIVRPDQLTLECKQNKICLNSAI